METVEKNKPIEELEITEYKEANDFLNPLRWHLQELIESMETLNRLEIACGHPPWALGKIESAKKLTKMVNDFCTLGTK